MSLSAELILSLRRAWRLAISDVGIGVLVFLIGMAIGVTTIQLHGVGDFYRERFDVAVMSACGREFARPVFANTPEGEAAATSLFEFLRDPDGVFDCSTLDHVSSVTPPILFQRFMPYLLNSAALIWRVRGVSWNALAPLFGALCGMLLCGVYVLARLFAGRLLSLGPVGLMALSSLHLENLPRLRDYAKAPFLIVGVALIGCLVARELDAMKRLWLAAAFGLAGGIGFGFRIDALLLLPFFVVSTVFLPPPGRSRNWREIGLVLLIALGVFVGSSLPMTKWYVRGGSNSWHFIVLGLSNNFNYDLDVIADPTYYLMSAYKDDLVIHLANSHATSNDLPTATLYQATYDRYVRDLYLKYCSIFPGDVIVRAYAAVFRVLDLPRWLPPRAGFGITALGVTLLVAANLRMGLFAALAIIYFGGTASLQFGVRHHFYLEAATVISLALLAQAVVSEGRTLIGRSSALGPGGFGRALRMSFSSKRLVRVCGFWATIVTLGAGSLATARAYQHNAAKELFVELASLRRQGVDFEQSRDEEGSLTFRPAGTALSTAGETVSLPALDNREEHRFYFAARIGGAECGFSSGTWAVEYEARSVYQDYPVELNVVAIPGNETLVLFPAFDNRGEDTIRSFKLKGMNPGCGVELSTVAERSRVGAPLTVVLDAGWEIRDLYQKMRIERDLENYLSSPDAPVGNAWSSGSVKGSGDPIEVSIPLDGADVIVLRVDDGGDGVLHFDHANWINPRLTTEQGALSWTALRPDFVEETARRHKVNQSVVGEPLRIGDQSFSTGLGTRANNQMTFRVPEWFDTSHARFEALVGIDGVAKDRGEVRFYVDIN